MAEAGDKLDQTVDRIVERTVNNGIGDLVCAQGLPGAFGGGLQTPGAGGGTINQLETVASNIRGWLISNQRTLLSELYAEHGLVETIVDVPVHDALRSGYDLVTSQLSPEEVSELQADNEEDGTNGLIGQGMKWTRLFGGGGLIIVTDQDPVTPLDMAGIEPGRPLEFVPFDLWELYRDGLSSVDPGDRVYGERSKYRMGNEHFEYYGRRIHRSRVIQMQGKEPPSFLRGRLQGWGLSVVETLIRSINQYLKSNALSFEVLDEFKLDVYKMEGFKNAMLTRDGTARILERIQMANLQKNFQNALVLDKNDDHTGKQLNFSGISEVMKEIRLQLASDLRIPMTKLFGLSASGFNSGEEDTEVYNGMVESEVRAPMRQLVVRVNQLKCQQRFGFVPDDLRVRYRPMRVLTATDEETTKTAKLNRVAMALEKRLMSGQEARSAINQDNLVGVQVEPEPPIEDDAGADDELTQEDPDEQGTEEEDPEAEGG